MDRTQKSQITDEVTKQVAASSCIVLSDFTGITVEEVTRLRSKIREQKGTFRVTKNTLAARALQGDGQGHERLRALLKGPNALTFAHQDPVAILKILTEFEKESNGKIKVRGGVLEGRFTSAAELKVIATLPPRETLLAQVVGTMAAPLSGFLNVLNGVPRSLLNVLKALEEKKSKAEGA